ncbi:hypothetical protein HS7_15750 [Sulfolobales archaeon HS-7]|nr:hypothetical protein HS7_15750 [Sulfolobales archaeon HS-7]
MNFLLTGLGFISNNVALYLSAHHNVTVTYRKLNQVTSIYAEDLKDKVEVVKAEPRSEDMRKLIEESDVVVNFIGEIMGDENTLRFANVEIPGLLAKLSSGKTFIHLSGATLGQQGSVVSEESPHGHGLNPTSPFEISKLEGEREVLKENENSIILRPTLVYGPNSAHVQFVKMYSMSKLISKFGVVPDIKISYMPVSVSYISKAIESLAEMKPKRSYLYATECEPKTITDLLTPFVSVFRAKWSKVSLPKWIVNPFLPGEVRQLLRYSGVIFSCDKMRNLVGEMKFREEELRQNALFLRELERRGLLVTA